MPIRSLLGEAESLARLVLAPVPATFAAAWALLGTVAMAFLLPRRQAMRHGLRIAVSLLAVMGAAGFVLWRSQQPEGEYYKHVDEVLANVDLLREKRLLVHGCVTSVLQSRREPGRYQIAIASMPPRRAATIEARYTGSVPDLLRVGVEVVVKGRLEPDGVVDVVPDGIMTKCPATYAGPSPPVSACAGLALDR
jgi:cytochrome c-type biogenesis protein CcmE